jgi:hypothetical protein
MALLHYSLVALDTIAWTFVYFGIGVESGPDRGL